MQPKILDLLHIGHFGMERMKQLARTAVYWPGGVAKVTRQYKAGDPVYALYYGPHQAKQPRWVFNVAGVRQHRRALRTKRARANTSFSYFVLFLIANADKDGNNTV
nr:hypothetical protein BaRGS_001165 [Batillaria attramentaria]